MNNRLFFWSVPFLSNSHFSLLEALDSSFGERLAPAAFRSNACLPVAVINSSAKQLLLPKGPCSILALQRLPRRLRLFSPGSPRMHCLQLTLVT